MYDTFGGHHRKPSEKMFMMADEFEQFALSVGLANDLCVNRDVVYCFNLSFLTQVDEINNERHTKA